MTQPKANENAIYDVQLESIQKDEYIDMKCTNCGYEEQMPDWVYGEEAGFLIEEGDPEPPAWQCVKCHKDTLVRKPD